MATHRGSRKRLNVDSFEMNPFSANDEDGVLKQVVEDQDGMSMSTQKMYLKSWVCCMMEVLKDILECIQF